MAIIRVPIQAQLVPERMDGTPGVVAAFTRDVALENVATGDYLVRDHGKVRRTRDGDKNWRYVALDNTRAGQPVRVLAPVDDPFVVMKVAQ